MTIIKTRSEVDGTEISVGTAGPADLYRLVMANSLLGTYAVTSLTKKQLLSLVRELELELESDG